MAAANDHALAVAALLSAGASTTVRNAAGNTPLLWAAHTGALQALRALVAAKSDVNVVNSAGRSAFDEALARHSGTAVLDLLVAAGAQSAVELQQQAAPAAAPSPAAAGAGASADTDAAAAGAAGDVLHNITDAADAEDAPEDEDAEMEEVLRVDDTKQ